MHANKYLCWWDSKNFGDALNPYVFKAFGLNVKYKQSDKADIIAIGSSMERLCMGALFDKRHNGKQIDVWGTGFHFYSGKHLWFPKIKLPEEFIRNTNIHALRGLISKARAESVTGKNLDSIALGDPGLLVGKIVDVSKIKKRYRLGIICHFTDKGNTIFSEIASNINGSVLIDVEDNPVNIIKKIAACDALISTAMHPIIAADSLRVPNLWINISSNKISKMKFDDYYSVFNIKPTYFNLNKRLFDSSDLNNLIESYRITDAQIEKIQNDLIKSFPYSNKINYLTRKDLIELRLREYFYRDKIHRRIKSLPIRIINKLKKKFVKYFISTRVASIYKIKK